MSKTFTVTSFNTVTQKIEKQYNMKTAEKANFRKATLYKCLVRESYLNKKGN